MSSANVEPITIRQSRLHQLINGKATHLLGNSNHYTKDVLLDTLVAVYDELSKDYGKSDKFILSFLEKFRPFMSQLNSLRVGINDFDVKQVIGRGHFGEVKLVREKSTGDVFAMKILKKADTLALQNVTFYEEERDIMAQAASPWITCLRYAFQDPRCLYLVMDFHPGGDLFGLLERVDGSLSEETTRFYMAELTLAISSLHKMGYVHRDIKPENILFDRLGHLKLADFGSAARLDAKGQVTSSMPVGTAEYIAPEVLKAMEAELDPKKRQSYGVECDYWSLGIVGYEMIYGSTPFEAEKKTVLMTRILNHKEHLKFPPDVEVSAEFKDVISCLLEDSQKRIGLSEVKRHSFFRQIDWENIRDMIPEYVPHVNSLDDTSNFEEFDNLPSSKASADDLMNKGGFTGKNLPFVGFTFTRSDAKFESDKMAARDKENADPRRKSLVEVNVVVNEKNKFNELAQKLTSEIKKRREMEEKVKSLHSGLDEANKKCRENNTELQKACNMLERERADRKASEAAALVKVREMKKQMTETWTSKLSTLEQELGTYKDKCCVLELARSQLEEQLSSAIKELELARKETKALRSKNNEYKEKDKLNRRSVLDAAVKAPELKAGTVNDSVAEFKSNEMKCQLEAAKEELVKMQKANQELQEEMQKLQDEVEFATAEKDSRIRELEDDLADKEAQQQALELLGDENRELKSRFAKLEAESQSSAESFARTSTKCLELQVKVNLLEKTLSESSLNSSLATNRSGDDVNALNARVETLSDELTRARDEIMRLKEEITNRNRDFQQRLDCVDSDSHSISSRDSAIASATPPPEQNSLIERHEATVKRLEGQLQSARDLNTAERKRMRELQDELTKKSQEAGEARIDLRISQRKLKQAQEMHEMLSKEKEEWSDKFVKKDKEIIDLTAKVAGLQSTVTGLEKTLAVKDTELKALEERKQAESERFQKRLESEQKKVESMKELQAELAKMKDEVRVLNRQKASAQEDVASAVEKMKQKENQQKAVVEELEKLKKQLGVYEKRIKGLENAVKELDEENDAHEKQRMETEAEVDSYKKKIASLVEQIDKLREEVRTTRVSLNEEKSMKIFNEKKMRDMENNLKTLEDDSSSEIKSLTGRLQEQTAFVERLSAENVELLRQLEELENEFAELRKHYSASQEQTVKLKEDLSNCYTKINGLQDRNSVLCSSLEEAIEKAEQHKERSDELENILAAEKQHFKERQIKSEATVAQQAKLIDYLQSKVDAPVKKKKNFIEKIFGAGGKDNAGGYAIPAAYKDLEAALQKERQKARELTEMNDRLRSELTSLNLTRGTEGGILKRNTEDRKSTRSGKIVVKEPVSAKLSEAPSDGTQPPAKPQRMAHDIPHRFEQKINLHGNQCPLCMDNVPIGNYVAVCTECKCVAHVKCSHKLPATCGMPYGFYEHYSASSDVSTTSGSVSPSVMKDMKGWVKIPKSGRGRWEKRYLSVESKKLVLYEHEPVPGMEPLEALDLSDSAQRVLIVPAVQQSEVPHCASMDLPFVFKVETEPHTTCFPGRSLFVLTSGYDEKRNWIAALEHACNYSAKDGQQRTGEIKSSRCCRTLATWKASKMEINCAVQMNDVALLGTSDGLFSVSLKDTSRKPVFIDVNGPVYQIVIVPQISTAIMIAGENRNVALCNLGALQAVASSSISSASLEILPVNEQIDCHLISASMLEDVGPNGEAFLCAADPTKIMVSHWDKASRKFTVRKCITTSIPCSCVYFTNQSAIVGCEKLLEIDLKKFEVEEFLEASDVTLSTFVFSSKQLGLYPLAILDVSSKKRKQSEYLICYKEFGIFVDAWGKRTRSEDVKWTRIPLAFAFRKPFLFLVNTNEVEVIQLRKDSYTKAKPLDEAASDVFSSSSAAVILPDSVRVPVTNPRLLGSGNPESTIFLASRTKNGQDFIELTGEASLRRNLSDSSQGSMQSTSTEDPASFRPPLRALPDDLLSVTSTTTNDTGLVDDLLDDALNYVDSEVDSRSETSVSSKRPSSELSRPGEKRVKFSDRR